MEKQFLREFEEWVRTQVTVNEMAMTSAEKLALEGDDRAKEALLRYESKLDAYTFILGKFANYHEGKSFHELPDGLFGERKY